MSWPGTKDTRVPHGPSLEQTMPNHQQPRTGGEMEGQELLTSLAKSFGDPWLRSSVTEVGLPPTLGLPLLPLTWLPLTRWVHFCQVPRNRATPGFRSVKSCVSNQGEHMLPSRIPIGRLWPSLRSDNSGHAGLVHKIAAGPERADLSTQVPSDGAQLGSREETRTNNRAHETAPHGENSVGASCRGCCSWSNYVRPGWFCFFGLDSFHSTE